MPSGYDTGPLSSLPAPINPLKGLRDAERETHYVQAESAPGSTTTTSDDALNLLRDEHADELRNLLQNHAQTVNSLRSDNAETIAKLRQNLITAQSEHAAKLLCHTTQHETSVMELQQSHDLALKALGKEHDELAMEMEQSLMASDEERRQLKMRVDQAMFELSRARDEHQVQRNHDARQIAALERTQAELGRTKADLEGAVTNLSGKLTELEQKFRKSGLPPQGPAPTTPLPPLPRQLRGSDDGSHSDHSVYSKTSIGACPGSGPQEEHIAQCLREREGMMVEFREKQRETEVHLVEERVRADNLAKDLHDARKTCESLCACRTQLSPS